MKFFEDPLALPYRVDVFERFVSDFEHRINQLRLVEMCVQVSKDIDSTYAVNFFPITLTTFSRPRNPPNVPDLSPLPTRGLLRTLCYYIRLCLHPRI